MEQWERDLIDRVRRRVLEQAALVEDGSLSLLKAATQCNMMPSEFEGLYEQFTGRKLSAGSSTR